MPHTSHFQLADDYLNHLDSVIGVITDPFIQSRCTGFLAVSAVTVYELAIKTIFIEFAEGKHKVLGNFASAYFERLNGKIRIVTLKDEYIKKFGEKYVSRFEKILCRKEAELLKTDRVSPSNCYRNIVTWRHDFVHEGTIPANATYSEVRKSYSYGKHVINCLAETMRR
ncbi:MAG: hypothetical protein HQL16_01335 [Candidatus Omnitrophica bacterium]|nr:hypothetical protein [Candidatus Omnitrophota bacterium]